MKYFLGNHVENKVLSILILSIIVILFTFRAIYVTSFAASWDIVDFALGVREFDLLKMQPHFPGYPYFILGGIWFNQWIGDPVKALATFNIFMTALSSVPIYFICRKYATPRISLLGVLFIHSFIFLSLLSVQPMSEAAAISLVWWYIWSLFLALNSKSLKVKFLPLLFLSLILGVRLSYLPFASGIIFLWWKEWKTYIGWIRFKRLVIQLFFAIMLQFIWVFGLAASLGSFMNLIHIGLAFSGGHFNEWGGSISASDHSFLERLVQYVWYNIIWTGLFGQSEIVALLFVFLIFLIIMNSNKLLKMDQYKYLLLLLFCSYFLWGFFAQNVEKARHIAPLVSILTFVIYTSFVSKISSLSKFITCTIIIMNLIIGGYLVIQQSTIAPSTYQLANYLEKMEGDFIVYTWEETRTMEYLQSSYEHKRVWTYENFLADVSQYESKKIYLTNHVIKGFKQQGINIEKDITQIAKFQSNKMLYPVYHNITLYQFNRLK